MVMGVEVERPIDVGNKVKTIREAAYLLLGYAKAFNSPERMEDTDEIKGEITNQLDILIAELEDFSRVQEGIRLKQQILEQFRLHQNQLTSHNDAETIRDLIDQLVKMAREQFETEPEFEELTSGGVKTETFETDKSTANDNETRAAV